MNVELFSVCDSAHDYAGKLVIVGTYDMILAKQIPAVHPVLSVAARLRFFQDELGDHRARIFITNSQDREEMSGMDGTITIRPSSQRSSVVNLVIHLVNIKITNFGEYSVKLQIDDDIAAEVPLFISQAT